MKNPSKIQVRGLKKSFNKRVVLDGIDFDLREGESFVVIGGSGTGKSVLIKCILGLIKPDAGSIKIDGEEIVGLSYARQQKALDKVGMLFQGGALFDSMSVWKNVAFVLTHGDCKGKNISLKEAKEIALEKLKAVDLDESVANNFPAELSGGMQKRVALARAITADPEVIFFDEPTTGLDPIVSGTINQLIIDSVRRIGASALTITHDMASLRKIADRVGLLFKGKLIWTGTVKEMDATNNPYVQQFITGSSKGPFTDI